QGWSGVNVEPDARLADLLRRERPRDLVVEAVCSDQAGTIDIFETGAGEGWSTVEMSATETVETALAASMHPRQVERTTLARICSDHVRGPIDFLKIDAKAHEHQVIRGADWRRWRPRVVIVEATAPHTTVPSHDAWEPILLEADYIPAGF